jgi:hypothetical protein
MSSALREPERHPLRPRARRRSRAGPGAPPRPWHATGQHGRPAPPPSPPGSRRPVRRRPHAAAVEHAGRHHRARRRTARPARPTPPRTARRIGPAQAHGISGFGAASGARPAAPARRGRPGPARRARAASIAATSVRSASISCARRRFSADSACTARSVVAQLDRAGSSVAPGAAALRGPAGPPGRSSATTTDREQASSMAITARHDHASRVSHRSPRPRARADVSGGTLRTVAQLPRRAVRARAVFFVGPRRPSRQIPCRAAGGLR